MRKPQPMRSPAQTSVNVIVREDLEKMRQTAKYKGMEAQAQRTQTQLRQQQ